MTYAEYDRFKNNDEKKYIVENNEVFLNWYNEKLENGYHPYLDLKGIQHLINYMVSLYEFKYCDAYYSKQRGKINVRNFIGLNDISNFIDFDQIRYRLSHKELETLDCKYRSNNGYCSPAYNEDGSLNHDKYDFYISFNLKEKTKYEDYYSFLNSHKVSCRENGVIPRYELKRLKEYIGKKDSEITIENLLYILQTRTKLDTTEIEKIIATHKIDLELRNKIFEMIGYAMIYSEDTIPEYGLLRAKRFVNEINEYYNLFFDCYELDKLIIDSKYENIFEEKKDIEEIKNPSIIKKFIKTLRKNN